MCVQFDLAREEKCEFVSFQSPKQVITRNRKIIAIEFCRTEQNENGEWTEDEEQICRLKANFIICAFGSGLQDSSGTNLAYIKILFPSQRKMFLKKLYRLSDASYGTH